MPVQVDWTSEIFIKKGNNNDWQPKVKYVCDCGTVAVRNGSNIFLCYK